MKRHLFLVALALLALCAPTTAHATPTLTSLSLRSYFVQCSGGTTADRTLSATAVAGGSGITSQYRIRWTITGPITSGGNAAVVNYSPGNGGIIGSDLADTMTRTVNCTEWGYYQVKAELLPPTGNNTPLSDLEAAYEATYRTPLHATQVIGQIWTSPTCGAINMNMTLVDADSRPVKNVPLLIDFLGENSGCGDEREVVTNSSGNANTTFFCSQHVNDNYDWAVAHYDLSVNHYLDPLWNVGGGIITGNCP